MIIAITGATGSFGLALAKHLLATTDYSIRLLGRSESKLADLQRDLAPYSNRSTYILSDIRDQERLLRAFAGADWLFHAAALKQVPMSYTHTSEFVKTNIVGTRNVAMAAMNVGVKKVLFVSSDKAASPYNPYGVSKSMAEHIITEANMHVPRTTTFSSVRGGNVWGSRGSVVEQWTNSKLIKVTEPAATRFHLPMKYWLEFCVEAIAKSRGGEVFAPKCKAWQLSDLARAFCEEFGATMTIIGKRDGDKQHEMLVSEYEFPRTVDTGWAYVIEPVKSIRDVWEYKPHTGNRVLGYVVSNQAGRLMTVEQLRRAIVDGG